MSDQDQDQSNDKSGVDSVFIIETSEPKSIKKLSDVAMFDLDWTLVKPKKGKHPKDKDDWMFMPGVKDKLIKLNEDGVTIIIFTNQSSTKFNLSDLTHKINNMSKELNVPLVVYGCTETSGNMRKPCVGMWDMMLAQKLKRIPDMNECAECFYVGDAAGRTDDFADSDYKFALNMGVQFYVPEQYFTNGTTTVADTAVAFTKPIHPLEKYMMPAPKPELVLEHGNSEGTEGIEKTEDSEKTEGIEKTEGTDSNLVSKYDVKPTDNQEMIVLVGPPSSTKSTFSSLEQFSDYAVISQDDLGSKLKAISAAKKAIQEGKSVIIDRMNEQIINRGEFIKLAKDLKITSRIMWFDYPADLCKHMNAYREITTGKRVPTIVYNKYYGTKGLETPTVDEGVVSVSKIKFEIDLRYIEDPKLFYSYLTSD